MARVSTLDPANLDADTAQLLEPMREKWGQYITGHLIYARRPKILAGLLAMNDGLNSASLDGALTSLVNRRVAAINGCFA